MHSCSFATLETITVLGLNVTCHGTICWRSSSPGPRYALGRHRTVRDGGQSESLMLQPRIPGTVADCILSCETEQATSILQALDVDWSAAPKAREASFPAGATATTLEHGCSAGAPPAGLGIHAGGLDLLAKPSCLCQLRPTHIVMLRRERRVLTLAFDSSFLRCATFVDSSRRFESLLWLGRSSTLRP